MKKILLALMIFTSLTQAQEIYATFNVEAAKSVNLAFTASGIVKSVNVDIGSVVKKNQTLATLGSDDIRAMLESAKTTYKYAKRDLDRQEKIKKLIDAGKFDAYASRYEKAKNAVAYQKALYDKTFLKAPLIYPYANANNRKIKAEVKAKDFTVGLFGDGYILTNSGK